MARNQKKRNQDLERSEREQAQATPVDPAGRGWANAQIGNQNYFFLVVCVVAQLATIMISWPTWQVRDVPPNLPWLESTPQFSCGVLLIATLAGVLLSPRRFGLAVHLIILAIAIGMDQFRCQPQVLSVAFLMTACVWTPARRVCVWFLVSMWLWAGIHKLVSPDWFMQTTYQLLSGIDYQLLSRIGLDPSKWHFGFAMIIAVSEILLGLMAWLRPRLAAVGCVALHIGIAIFLILIGWNQSVLPWNISTAIVGAWLLWNHNLTDSANQARLRLPGSLKEKIAVGLVLIVPVGIYLGLVRHCFAHVLYSGNLPIGLVTHHDGVEELEVWDKLQFPFPNEPKAYRDYFKLTGSIGEKLHIRDPRPGFSSQYFRLEPTRRLTEITFEEFFEKSDRNVEGVAVDDPRKIYLLEKGNATLLKRSKKEMIYAVKFDPSGFDPKLLSLLHGLPNLEQIQLANCAVNDEDLKQIFGFKKLMGIGLNETSITDAGLRKMKDLPALIVLEYEGTAITTEGLQAIGVPH